MPSEDFFLVGFFGEGNQISWSAIAPASDVDGEKARPWVERYLANGRPAPLPRVRRVGSTLQTTWYLIVDTRDAAALVRSEVQAFLGPSYTDWDPLADRFDPGDPIDSLVRQHHPHSLKVTITDSPTGRGYGRRAIRVRERLALWLGVRGRQPANIGEEREFLADLVYRFEDALRLDRLDLAEDHLRRMGRTGGLSPENLSGLEFLLLEARGAWPDIWRKGSYDRLVEVGPPRRVAQAMLRAAYRIEILTYEHEDDASGALDAYRLGLASRCAPLLGTVRGLTAPEVHVLLLCRELTRRSTTRERIDTARVGALKAGGNEAWIDSLVAAAGEVAPRRDTPTIDVFGLVGREFGLDNLDAAWSLAYPESSSAERSIWLLRLALEADSVTWAHDALRSIEGLGGTSGVQVLEALTGRVQGRFGTAIGQAASDEVPSGWLDWATRLGATERFKNGITLAESGRTDWSLGHGSTLDWGKFADSLSGVSEVNEAILRRSVPHLLTALGEAPLVEPGLAAVYDRLLNVVLLDPAPGDTYFLSVGDLVDRRLSVGIGKKSYSTLLEDLSGPISQFAAPVNVAELLELVDLLFFRVCPEKEARLRLVTSVLTACRQHLERLSVPLLAVLSQMAKECGWSEDPFEHRLAHIRAGETAEQVAAARALEGLTVAMYSLDEAALLRARSAVLSLNSAATVNLYSDEVASGQLLAAAKNADLFVVAHRSAKHAATEALQAARRGPLVFAQGKGSSSLVSAIWEWAESRLGGSG